MTILLMGGISGLDSPSLLNLYMYGEHGAASPVLPQSDWFNSVVHVGSFVIQLAVLLSDL
jgi:hypothetical protein